MSTHAEHPIISLLQYIDIPQLPELVRFVAGKGIEGAVEELCHDSVYRLGNGNLLQIIRSSVDGLPSFDIYKRISSGFERIHHDPCFNMVEFEAGMVEAIKQHGGSLNNASRAEITDLAMDLHKKLPTAMTGVATTANALDQTALGSLMKEKKTRLLDGKVETIREIASHPATSAGYVVEAMPRVQRSEQSAAKLLREESRFRKIGLVIGGATVLVGAIVYANQLMNKNREREL
jgi:hypothetical protein